MLKDFKHFDLFGHMTFAKAIVNSPFRMAASMPDQACFYYVISGKAGVVTTKGIYDLQPEEGLLMQCGNYLNDYFKNNEVQECEAFAVHFNVEVLKTLYDKDFPEFLLDVGNIKSVGYEKFESTDIMKSYVENLRFYFEHPELVSEELLKIKLKEIILLLAKTDNAEKIRRLLSSLFCKEVSEFKEIIEANIFSDISIKELAFICNLSLSSFKRNFKKIFNQTPGKYIKTKRLIFASKKLLQSNDRISDIAFDTGFSDLAHFSRSFQTEFKQSPTEYRLSQLDK